MQLRENIAQRRRQALTLRDGERKAHGLPRLVIGVLPEDDGPHALRRRGGQSEKRALLRRVDRSGGPRRPDPLQQRRKIRGAQLLLQIRRPRAEIDNLHGNFLRIFSDFPRFFLTEAGFCGM